MRWKAKDLGLMGSAVVIGMTLVFMFLTVSNRGAVDAIVGIGIGAILLLLGLGFTNNRHSRRRREILEFHESVSIPPHTHLDIIFEPEETLKTPRLTCTSTNFKVMVDEIWHAGIGTLMGQPKPLYLWHRGQYYPGKVNRENPILARLRNESNAHAIVAAKLVGYREKA